MEPATLQNRVKDCIAVTMMGTNDTAAIKEDAKLSDLGLDSLDRVQLRDTLEHEFGVDASDADSQLWITVGDVTRYVKAHGK